jgi:4'-phosphopantetheinyl transferase
MQARAEVWLVDGRTVGDAQLDDLVHWLSASELARYGRFVRGARQRQFLIGRVLARQALGTLLSRVAQSLTLEEVAGLKPVLKGVNANADFSISHSGPWVACAVSRGARLGLDIEVIDPARDITALAAQAFGDERCAWLADRPGTTRLRDFYNLWSAQEAAIKLGAPAVQTLEIFHAELSVVLCCAGRLDTEAQLITTAIGG